MARNWSDIAHEVDDFTGSTYWAPDTPDFLEKRAARQNQRTKPPASGTPEKAPSRINPKSSRLTVERRRDHNGAATIIAFERLDQMTPPAPPNWLDASPSRAAGSPAPPRRSGQGAQYANDFAWDSPSRPAASTGTTAKTAPQRNNGSDPYRDDPYWGARKPRVSRQNSSARNASDGSRASRGHAARNRGYRKPSRQGVRFDEQPYRGSVMAYGADLDYVDETEERQEKGLPLRERWRRVRHDARRRKADRSFERNFEDAPRRDEGPRAAVYEGKMGRKHHQAARMQAQRAARIQAQQGSSIFDRIGELISATPLSSFASLIARPHFAVTSLALVCTVAVTIMVFPAAQDYYVGMRTKDQAAAEYQAVLDRNAELENHLAALQTDEGIEQLAHENLGWVKEGENSVSVIGKDSSAIDSESQGDMASVAVGSIPAPTTWYSPVLDAVFGYQDPSLRPTAEQNAAETAEAEAEAEASAESDGADEAEANSADATAEKADDAGTMEAEAKDGAGTGAAA